MNSLVEEGIQIDLSDEHPRNASASIRSRLEFDSNVNVESDLHSPKQYSQRRVIDEGIQSDVSDEHPRNASASIRSRLEFDSNVKVESDLYSLKHSSQRL
jgi:hypothetical protein